MSIAFATIKTALTLWARTNTGLTYAIWSDQNSPQPLSTDALKSDAYVTLRYDNINQIGQDAQLLPTDNPGNVIIAGNREWTLFIQIKGKNAFSLMNDLRDSLQKETVRDILTLAGIVFVDNFSIQNITGLDDTEYIERASMDVLFRAASSITDIVGTIKNIEVTETIKDAKGDQVYQDTFTIDTES